MGTLSNAAAHATVAVSDLARAKSFYSDTLGLKLAEENEAGIRFETGATLLGVYPSQFAGTAKNTVAEFDVQDLDAAMGELRGRRVTFEEYDFPGLKTTNGVAQLGDSHGAWFKDPDGNILALLQRG
jgi:catechol 2,3-dioxygenase-like lactoylglutathione lyase family enzyme